MYNSSTKLYVSGHETGGFSGHLSPDENHITKRQVVGFSQACHLVADITFQEGYYAKNYYSFDDTPANVTKVRVVKGRAKYARERFDLSSVALMPKYPTERLLTPRKCNDLRSLLSFLESDDQTWLNSLLGPSGGTEAVTREASACW